jgi:MFS family permease
MTDGIESQEFRRGWRPLLAAAIGIGLGLSPLPTFTAGVFAVALHNQFGWSRSAILASSFTTVAALLLFGPVAGRLADRYGPRPVALWSTLGLGLGGLSLALINSNIWTYYAAFTLMSVIGIGTMPVVYGKIVSLWFDRHRGLALGIALCTTGLSGMFLPIYTQTLINHFGWRWAFVGVALLPLLVALPILAVLLPKDSLAIRTARAQTITTALLEGFSVPAALRNYRYWLITFAALTGGLGLGGVVFNMIPLLVDGGLTPTAAAKLFGLYGLTVIIGRLISGWLLDRFWAPAVGAGFMTLPMICAAILAMGLQSAPVLALAICLLGLSGGAEFDLVAYLTSRYFGRRNFGALYAGNYAAFGLGSGVAPALYAVVHDRTGSYVSVLIATAILFAVAGSLMLALGRYPQLPPGAVDAA